MAFPERMNPFHSLPEPPDERPPLSILSASFSACALSPSTTGMQQARMPESTPQRLSSAEDRLRSGVSAGLPGEPARKWRRANPDYWKKYRQDHPQQVERNRRQQRLRDLKRRLANLANNNLAAWQVLIFQSPEPSEQASPAPCKQHLSGAASSAGL
jgi:hypothetical protein